MWILFCGLPPKQLQLCICGKCFFSNYGVKFSTSTTPFWYLDTKQQTHAFRGEKSDHKFRSHLKRFFFLLLNILMIPGNVITNPVSFQKAFFKFHYSLPDLLCGVWIGCPPFISRLRRKTIMKYSCITTSSGLGEKDGIQEVLQTFAHLCSLNR